MEKPADDDERPLDDSVVACSRCCAGRKERPRGQSCRTNKEGSESSSERCSKRCRRGKRNLQQRDGKMTSGATAAGLWRQVSAGAVAHRYWSVSNHTFFPGVEAGSVRGQGRGLNRLTMRSFRVLTMLSGTKVAPVRLQLLSGHRSHRIDPSALWSRAPIQVYGDTHRSPKYRGRTHGPSWPRTHPGLWGHSSLAQV